MQAVIVAGGLATRLGEIARDCPKSMVRILGRPFLAYQLALLRRGGVGDVVICLGHLGDQVEDFFGDGRRYGVTLRYSREDTPLGTAGALKNAAALLDERFFVMYGDSYVPLDFSTVFDYFLARHARALMTVYRNEDRYDMSNTTVQDGLVVRYSKTERTTDTVFIDYGVTLLSRESLDDVPGHCFCGLEDLFPRLIAKNQLLAYEVKERFYEIGSIQGLRDFTRRVEGVTV